MPGCVSRCAGQLTGQACAERERDRERSCVIFSLHACSSCISARRLPNAATARSRSALVPMHAIVDVIRPGSPWPRHRSLFCGAQSSPNHQRPISTRTPPDLRGFLLFRQPHVERPSPPRPAVLLTGLTGPGTQRTPTTYHIRYSNAPYCMYRTSA